MEKCLSSTALKIKKIFIKCAQNRRCTCSIYEQSLYKEWKLLKVTDYTNQTPSKYFEQKKCLSSRPRRMIFSPREMCIFGGVLNLDIFLNINERKLLQLQITQTRHHLSILDVKMSKINTPQKWFFFFVKCAQNRRCTSLINMQSLNIKVWILLELQITQTRHPLSISDGKNVKVQHPSKMRNLSNGAHLQPVNNHYAKFE